MDDEYVRLHSILAEIRSDVAVLAQLRRAWSGGISSCPRAWPYLMRMPDRTQEAARIGMSLFALHVQSAPIGFDVDVDDQRQNLGKVLADAVKAKRQAGTPDAQAHVERRMCRLENTRSQAELRQTLRSITAWLSGLPVPVDYAQLARDYSQYRRPSNQQRIKRHWAIAFARSLY